MLYQKKYIQKVTRYLVWALVVTLGLGLIIYSVKFHPASPAKAVSTYVVDSNGDEPDDNPGDDTCHTAINTCTLRAAIQEANAHTGADIINFNNAYTISPATAYPNITDQVEINGYTNSPGGATPNTAIAPNPFNGTLTVVINGSLAGSVSGLNFNTGSDNSVVKGLVINNFNTLAKSAIEIATDNITIQGNYVGTSADGTTAQANDGGIQQGANDSDNAQIGGTNPADRNIISGNTSCGSSPNTNSDNWVYEGNYIGPAADGVTGLGNGSTLGCGGLSIDNNNGCRIGGTTAGAANLISGNGGGGIQPDNTDGVVIQGNLIGTNYTGTAALANGQDGVSFSQTNTNALIGGTTAAARNIVSGNTAIGVALNAGSSNNTIQGNYIGTDITGTQPLGNGSNGVRLLGASNNIIGSTSASGRNIISANGTGVSSGSGIAILGTAPFGGSPADGNVVQGNYIGTDVNGELLPGLGNDTAGVFLLAAPTNNLIGGTVAGAANIIAGNGAGIFNAGFSGVDGDLNNSFLGNSIYSNTSGPVSQIGIDLANTPDGATFTNTGVTANDVGDPDDSTNHYMNFPVINSVTSSNGQVTINYDLDINDSETGATGYRVEFFANDSADPSGYGQGQTYLGFDTVAGDVTGRQVTLKLPNGYSGNKYISATTTMTDNSTDGFGHTSEFAADVQASLLPPTPAPTPNTNSSSLADTGQTQHSNQLVILAILLIFTGCTTLSITLIKLKR